MRQSNPTDHTSENKLPKNIRQIGQANQSIKIYIEDYAMTYLKRLLVEEEESHKVAILLGKRQIEGEHTYLFVQGIVEAPEEIYKDKKYSFTESIWSFIFDTIQTYFDDKENQMEILGWSVLNQDDGKKLGEEIEYIHRTNFSENYTTVLLMDVLEGEEYFFVCENGKFQYMEGYYIYFEKNECMDRYVQANQKKPCVEAEQIVKGKSESYRTILQQRKEEINQKKTMSFLYAASTFLVMVVVVLGVTMMNNYEKMKNMQDVLATLSKSMVDEDSDKPVETENVTNAEDAVEDNQTVPDTEKTMTQANKKSGQESLTSEKTNGTQMLDSSEASVDTTQEPIATETAAAKEPEQASMAEADKKNYYEILPGDTLVSISRKIYQTETMVDQICKHNGIENSDQIVAGDIIVLP